MDASSFQFTGVHKECSPEGNIMCVMVRCSGFIASLKAKLISAVVEHPGGTKSGDDGLVSIDFSSTVISDGVSEGLAVGLAGLPVGALVVGGRFVVGILVGDFDCTKKG